MRRSDTDHRAVEDLAGDCLGVYFGCLDDPMRSDSTLMNGDVDGRSIAPLKCCPPLSGAPAKTDIKESAVTSERLQRPLIRFFSSPDSVSLVATEMGTCYSIGSLIGFH